MLSLGILYRCYGPVNVLADLLSQVGAGHMICRLVMAAKLHLGTQQAMEHSPLSQPKGLHGLLQDPQTDRLVVAVEMLHQA